MSDWQGNPDLRAFREFGAAVLAAGLGAYIRARRDPKPLTWPSLGAYAAEAVVCGFMAFGIAELMGWNGSRTATALAAALGLLGTGVLSDLLVKVLGRKADSA